ncbi:MAG: serine hydrolase domain-containing protein [Terriglobia bacterium]|nr:serine hydrolase domain-containing protein [Terriglobia bacterium]
MRTRLRLTAIVLALVATSFAQAQLSPDVRAKIDDVAKEVLATTGVPSASIAIVQNGQMVYAQAYGDARVEPKMAANTNMRYGVGSISKQFTASAILLLQQEGKLKLDDPVGKFVPNLTRANEVTIREILSHTSGYQDYWPQDYVMPFIAKPTTVENILDRWARIPLDFEPGTKWQYSNTNYTIAGVIVEKASGEPILKFLTEHIFKPLGMHSVMDIDESHPVETDAVGYLRYALGPPRVAPLEGKGWMFAAGELYMTPSDLAKWNISMMNQTILKPESYKEMETDTLLKDGVATGYGLGVEVGSFHGHRMIEHSGEVSGFVAENMVFPDDKVAVTVLTNQDASSAAGQIGQRIAPLLFPAQSANAKATTDRARKTFEDFQKGTIDRSQFTEDANYYFTDQAVKDYAASLGALGEIQDFRPGSTSLRGGMTHRSYFVRAGGKSLVVSIFEMPNGKYEQYLVRPQQ